ncbi:hypothetical protein BCR42DRAFT_220932 [Absidia repens]|uniref:ubiquitinyl hydrolase 1 n=1 Tax=Absidia repens TaxID=90262 RepID=A0A1X2INN1_9FUNG|nr:hypothetical protein BCR42DRAFT_220932 [Absidia repens]
MPSEKTLSLQPYSPVICFGNVTRDEINSVLTEAGISLTPPSKTPFATGIKRRRRRKSKPPTASKSSSTKIDISPSSSSISPSISQSLLPSISSGMPTQETTTSPTATTPSTTKTTTTTAPSSGKTTIAKPTPSSELSSTSSTSSLSAKATIATASPTPKLNSKLAAASSSATTTTTAATTTAPSAPSPTPVKPPSSWASLLKPTIEKTKLPATSPSQQTRATVSDNATLDTLPPKKFTGIADIIHQYEPTYKMPLLQPRGLINNVNTCFMNVILQPLSHAPPFYNLIKTIGQHVVHNFKSKTPLLDSLIEFINEYRPENPDGEYGEPFVPEYVYDALRGQKRFDSLRGRQEDAEEFLCFLLDGLHEEMVSVLKAQLEKQQGEEEKKQRLNGNGQSDWLEVGHKNKTASLRTTGFDESPIKKVFGGTGRSVLRCPGAKDSVTIEPYQSLPLDIQPDSVRSIEDAIRNMTLPEIMHDYMSPKGVRVDATKQVYLENLPSVLILHVKRFVFDNVGGVQKLRKQVRYSSTMTIQEDWMARSSSSVTYQLFGVVYHHGSSAGGGHYTCDIKRHNGEWLHIDDTTIVSVKEEDVLVTEQNTQTSEQQQADQTAYILFYMKS